MIPPPPVSFKRHQPLLKFLEFMCPVPNKLVANHVIDETHLLNQNHVWSLIVETNRWDKMLISGIYLHVLIVVFENVRCHPKCVGQRRNQKSNTQVRELLHVRHRKNKKHFRLTLVFMFISSVLNTTVQCFFLFFLRGGVSPNSFSNIFASALFLHICFKTLQDLDILICRIFLV